MSGTEDVLLRGATLLDGRLADVSLAGGRIEGVREAGPEPAGGQEVIELGGALLSPAFVEGHVHLDKTFLGSGWRPHRPGRELAHRIRAEKEMLREADSELPRGERAWVLLQQLAANGTGYVRSHVDIDPEVGLAGLHMLLALRERARGLVNLQIVAFPQSGILACPGTAELLDAALHEGADVVGGLDPVGIDADVEGQLDVVFGLAERHGKPIDIHLHDRGLEGTRQLRRIAERSEQSGLQGRVAVSHAYALGMVDGEELAATAEALARGGVAIMTNAPGGTPMPPVLRLHEAGVTVFAGSDNIRDAWWPYGNGDMLERASIIGYRQRLYTDDELRLAFDLATAHGARVLGVDGYGLEPGDRADLVAIDARNVQEAVVAHPPRRLVVHDGRVGATPGPNTR
jgi:cytosine deaminase